MNLSDPHCHLYFDAFDADREAVVERAFQSGLKFMINVGIDAASNQQAIDMAETHSMIFSTAGWHPHSADVDSSEAEKGVLPFLHHSSNVALGEIGLDYFRNKAPKDRQLDVFRRLARLAGEHQKPIVIHSRDAFEDTINIIKEVRQEFSDLSAVFHCYTYDVRALEEILKLNLLISFTGIVTFGSAKELQEVAKEVPGDCFMIETDCPYLTPIPHRGKRNEPAMVSHIAEAIAILRNEDPSVIAESAMRNSARFFGIPLE